MTERIPLNITPMPSGVQTEAILGQVERTIPQAGPESWTAFMELLPSLVAGATDAVKLRATSFLLKHLLRNDLFTRRELEPGHVDHLFRTFYLVLRECTDDRPREEAIVLATALLPFVFHHSYIREDRAVWNSFAHMKDVSLERFDTMRSVSCRMRLVRFWMKCVIAMSPAKRSPQEFVIEAFSPLLLKPDHFLKRVRVEKECNDIMGRVMNLPYTGKLSSSEITGVFNALMSVARERDYHAPAIARCWMSWRKISKEFSGIQVQSLERTSRNLLGHLLKHVSIPLSLKQQVVDALKGSGLKSNEISKLTKANIAGAKRAAPTCPEQPVKRLRGEPMDDTGVPDDREKRQATPVPASQSAAPLPLAFPTGPSMLQPNPQQTSTLNHEDRESFAARLRDKLHPRKIPVRTVVTLILETLRSIPEQDYSSILQNARRTRVLERHKARIEGIIKRSQETQQIGSGGGQGDAGHQELAPSWTHVGATAFNSEPMKNLKQPSRPQKGYQAAVQSGTSSGLYGGGESSDDETQPESVVQQSADQGSGTKRGVEQEIDPAVDLEEFASSIGPWDPDPGQKMTSLDMGQRLLSFSRHLSHSSSLKHDKLIQFYVFTFGRLIAKFMPIAFKEKVLEFVSEDLASRHHLFSAWLSAEWVEDERGREKKQYEHWFHQVLNLISPTFTSATVRVMLDAPLLTERSLDILLKTCESGKTMVTAFRSLRELLDYRPKHRQKLLPELMRLCASPSKAVRSHAILAAKHHAYECRGFRQDIEAMALRYFESMRVTNQGQTISEHVSQYSELVLALCTKRHTLLGSVLKRYLRLKPQVQREVRKLIPAPIKAIGMHSPFLLHTIETFPHGAESFVLRMVAALVEDKNPTPELIHAIMSSRRRRDIHPRFILPVADVLAMHDFASVMLHLISLLGPADGSPPKRDEAILLRRFITRIVKSGAVTAVDVLIQIHRLEDVAGIKQVIAALQVCLGLKDTFSHGVIAQSLQELIHCPRPPVVFMRTTIQSLSMYKGLEPLVTNLILPELIQKKVWTMPKLWEGFLRALRMIQEESAVSAIMHLPPAQIEHVKSRWPRITDKLKAFLRQQQQLQRQQQVALMPHGFPILP